MASSTSRRARAGRVPRPRLVTGWVGWYKNKCTLERSQTYQETSCTQHSMTFKLFHSLLQSRTIIFTFLVGGIQLVIKTKKRKFVEFMTAPTFPRKSCFRVIPSCGVDTIRNQSSVRQARRSGRTAEEALRLCDDRCRSSAPVPHVSAVHRRCIGVECAREAADRV